MHMADALTSPAVAATMGALTLGATAFSVVKTAKTEKDMKKVPLMGVMGAFVFAGQMLNFTIPGTGSSGHICGGLLLAALLGPYEAFLTMLVILLLQCLVFADGGLMALGCNIWNMAFYACFFGYFCIYRPIAKKALGTGIGKGRERARLMVGSILACVLSLQLGAFSVVLETKASGITELPFGTFVALMQPIHLAIGAVEGVLTGLVLIFVHETRPELLTETEQAENNRFSYKKVLVILGIVALVMAGGVSLVASQNPDGLEWSIAGVTGETELEAEGGAYDTAGEAVEATSKLFADYTVLGTENPIGTTAAGVIGAALVAVIAGGVCVLIGHKKRKTLEVNT